MKTSPFYHIRRAVIALWSLSVIGLGLVLESRLQLSQQVIGIARITANYFERAANYPKDRNKLSIEFEATVEKVLQGNVVQVEDPGGYLYNLQLAGALAPAPSRAYGSARRTSPSARSRQFLENLVLSNAVQVVATHINPNRTGAALFHVGPLNVNEELIAAGWAQFDQRHADLLPTAVRQTLKAAEAEARARGLGIWNPGPSDP